MPLTARQDKFLARVVAAIEEHEIEVPDPVELAHQLGVPPQAVTAILNLGVDRGDLRAVDSKLFYTTKQLSAIEARLRSSFGEQPFDRADFRKSLNLSRKFADPLFAYLEEEERFTRLENKVRLRPVDQDRPGNTPPPQ